MSRCINKIGQQFGKLIVDSINKEKSTNKHTYYNCHCICGNTDIIIKRSDTLNVNSNCGCEPHHKVSQNSINALVSYAKSRETKLLGQRFGKLTVIEYIGKMPEYCNANVWKCQCDCGNITYATTSNLNSGHIKSCGCLHSYKEMLITKFLNKNNISFKQEYCFVDLKNPNTDCYLRYDFALFNQEQQLIGLIEYNGAQHYDKNSSWYSKEYILRDQQKIKYCNDKNIPLLILNQNNFSYNLILNFYNKNNGGGG